MKIPSPLTDDPTEWTPEAVYEAVMFRVSSTDEEWDQDPASFEWDLSREEAARRIRDKDYSPPE